MSAVIYIHPSAEKRLNFYWFTDLLNRCGYVLRRDRAGQMKGQHVASVAA